MLPAKPSCRHKVVAKVVHAGLDAAVQGVRLASFPITGCSKRKIAAPAVEAGNANYRKGVGGAIGSADLALLVEVAS